MVNVDTMVSMRDARIEDAILVAWDLETATDRMFSFMLGGRWEQILIRVVNTSGNAWSIEHARIAEVEGKPFGVIPSGPSAVPEPDETFGLAWGWTRILLTVVGLVFPPFLSLMRQLGVGAWHITAISVMPEARGKGVSGVMNSDAIEHGRAAWLASAFFPRSIFAGGVRVQRMRLSI